MTNRVSEYWCSFLNWKYSDFIFQPNIWLSSMKLRYLIFVVTRNIRSQASLCAAIEENLILSQNIAILDLQANYQSKFLNENEKISDKTLRRQKFEWVIYSKFRGWILILTKIKLIKIWKMSGRWKIIKLYLI